VCACAALQKELAHAHAAVPLAAAARDEALAALRADVARERQVAVDERQAHAVERAELAAHAERARVAEATSAEEAAAAVARAVAASRVELAAEREASAAREAAAAKTTEEVRGQLERYRAEAMASQKKVHEEHTAALAAANGRVAGSRASDRTRDRCGCAPRRCGRSVFAPPLEQSAPPRLRLRWPSSVSGRR
jgi:hypothetical protein